jgi:hypothetical protein
MFLLELTFFGSTAPPLHLDITSLGRGLFILPLAPRPFTPFSANEKGMHPSDFAADKQESF